MPARCVKPPGRSLEPHSNARPRGMAVPQEQSRGQNSAYRSGCHNFLFSITYRTPHPCDAGVTRLLGQRQRYSEAGTRVSCFGRNNPLITARQRNNPGRASRQGRYRDQSRKRRYLHLLPLIRATRRPNECRPTSCGSLVCPATAVLSAGESARSEPGQFKTVSPSPLARTNLFSPNPLGQ